MGSVGEVFSYVITIPCSRDVPTLEHDSPVSAKAKLFAYCELAFVVGYYIPSLVSLSYSFCLLRTKSPIFRGCFLTLQLCSCVMLSF